MPELPPRPETPRPETPRPETPADATRARLRAAVRDLTAAAHALPDALAEHLAALDADLAGARADAERLRVHVDRLRADLGRAQERHTLEMEQAADENQQAAADAGRAVAAARADADRLRDERDAARAEAARLRDAADRRGPVPSDAPAARPRSPRTRTATAPPESASVPVETPAGPAARLAETFRAWCSAATPVMGKVEFFAGHTRTALPGASVAAVYRDANSQAQPVALSARGGASPVEHWLVALDGRHWLLPQPMTATQFRELGPCFEGAATPAGLTAVAPAEVRAVGDRYEIARAGRVA